DNASVQANTVMLAPKVGGYVVKVNFTEGMHVKKGTVLVELDDRDYKNNLNQLSAERLGLEAARRDAERNFGRISNLYKSEAVSQQQYDQTLANVSGVRARYDAVSAQIAQSELNLSNTKIVAPVDGVVARKSVEIGQLAAPGVPLLGFVGSAERWVVANFKETDLSSLKIGSKVDVKVDAIGGREFHGEIESMNSATGATFALLPPDNATGNFTKVVQRIPVRIKLPNLTPADIELLKAGLSAEVKVHKR
ncbi:MAG: HlyD family secretion protein, partial [Proteobacteria bacterium]